jgi:hypothetical protein
VCLKHVSVGDAIWPVDARTGQKPSPHWPAPQDIVGVLDRTVVAVTTFAGRQRVSGYDLLTGARLWSREPGTKRFSYDIEGGTLLALGDGVAIIDLTSGRPFFSAPPPITTGVAPSSRAAPYRPAATSWSSTRTASPATTEPVGGSPKPTQPPTHHRSDLTQTREAGPHARGHSATGRSGGGAGAFLVPPGRLPQRHLPWLPADEIPLAGSGRGSV